MLEQIPLLRELLLFKVKILPFHSQVTQESYRKIKLKKKKKNHIPYVTVSHTVPSPQTLAPPPVALAPPPADASWEGEEGDTSWPYGGLRDARAGHPPCMREELSG